MFLSPLSLTSLSPEDHPLLSPYANLKDEAVRAREFAGQHDVFLAESDLTVRALLASRFPVQSVLCTHAHWPRLEAAVRERESRDAASIPVYLAPDEALHALVGFPFHRGVLAAGLRPNPPTLADFLSCDTLTLLEGVSNHDNVGAIFRNVACLAGSRPGVILGPSCCDPLYRKSLRVSIGHVLSIPFATAEQLMPRRATAWQDLLDTLRAHAWQTLALTPSGDTTLDQVPSGKVALLVGAEGPGLTESTMRRCTARVRIPMRDGVDSLNVATSLAVAWSHLA